MITTNMDASWKATVVLALAEYRQLITKYVLHLESLREEDRKRRKAAILAVLRSRQQRNLTTDVELVIRNMDDQIFVRHFKISKHKFEYLLGNLQENGLCDHQTHLSTVSARKKLLMFLWYMGNQDSFRELSDKFDIPKVSIHAFIYQVLTIVSGFGATCILWPNSCEMRASLVAFNRLCGFDGVVGVIDCCHIRLSRPYKSGGHYFNQRSFYSVLLQAIVDGRGRFIDIFAGTPGSMDKASTLKASTFYTEWQAKMEGHRLLGDGAYDSRDFPFILTPKPEGGLLDKGDLERNGKICRGRAVVDQAFGRMKCKWKRLKNLHSSRTDNAMIIKAACYLHNLALGASNFCEEHPHGCPRQGDDNV